VVDDVSSDDSKKLYKPLKASFFPPKKNVVMMEYFFNKTCLGIVFQENQVIKLFLAAKRLS
jgi:hypothetical protein